MNENRNIANILLLCKKLIEKGQNSERKNYIIEINCSVIEAILLNYKVNIFMISMYNMQM